MVGYQGKSPFGMNYRQMKLEFRDWTIFGLIKLILAFLVGTVILFVLGIWAESNIRHFFEEYGWDTFLTRAFMAMPDVLAHHATWLAIGLLFGAAAAIWLIWAYPHRLGEHHALPKSQPIKAITAIVVLVVVSGAFYFAANISPTSIEDKPKIPIQKQPTAPPPTPPETKQPWVTQEEIERFKMKREIDLIAKSPDDFYEMHKLYIPIDPYKDDWMKISNNLKSVENIKNGYFRVFVTSNKVEVRMYFYKNSWESIKKLQVGDKLIAYCQLQGFSNDLLLVHGCELP